jgi:hypothetical protein
MASVEITMGRNIDGKQGTEMGVALRNVKLDVKWVGK